MKKRLIVITALTLLLAIAAIAQPVGPAAPNAPRAPRGGGEILGPAMLADFLDLTAAQIEQVKAMRLKFAETLKPLHEEQVANAEALKAAVDAGDATKAGQALLAGKALREKMKAAMDSQKAAFAALLTPAQKAKWDVYQEILALRQKAAGAKGPAAGAAPLPPMPPNPLRF